MWFSPDGTRIVSGAYQDLLANGTELKVWDARTGKELIDLTDRHEALGGFARRRSCVAFSPDGTRFLVAGIRERKDDDLDAVKVRDAKTGKILVDIQGKESYRATVLCASFSPDGQRIVGGSVNGTVRVWDARPGAAVEPMTLKGHAGDVNSVAFSPDGKRIVSGGADRTLKVWDVRTGTVLLELKGLGGAPTSVAFSLDGTQILYGTRGEDGRPGQASRPGQAVVLEPRIAKELPDEDEIAYRRLHTGPNPVRYREEYRSARAAKDDFASRFYLNLIPPAERKEAELQSDGRMFARMAELATTHRRNRKPAEAVKVLVELLALERSKLGPDHPDTLRSTANLANVYFTLGRRDEAVKLTEEVMARRKATLGPDHPDTLASMANLVNIYYALGRRAEAIKLFAGVLARRKAKLGPDHPDTLETARGLANLLMAAGRTPEALALLEKSSASDPPDMLATLTIAALRAWLGQEEEFSAIRRRALALARGTKDAALAERVAKLSSILPSSDKAELDAALALGRLTAKPDGFQGPFLPWRLLALGMAAYRAGDDPACDAALLAAGEAAKGIPAAVGTAAFYRAMSLHRRGRIDEARKLATEAAARMKLLPADARSPLAGGADHDDLILWLAYKEAKALIGFDDPATPLKPDGK